MLRRAVALLGPRLAKPAAEAFAPAANLALGNHGSALLACQDSQEQRQQQPSAFRSECHHHVSRRRTHARCASWRLTGSCRPVWCPFCLQLLRRML